MKARRRLAIALSLLAAAGLCRCGRSDRPAPQRSAPLVEPNPAAAAHGRQESEGPAGDRMGGIRGPRDNPDPHLARTEMLGALRQFGAVSAPTNDPTSTRGYLAGSEDIDTSGAGGLGAFGTGAGGGASIQGFGLGEVGRMGHGYGTGDGAGFGRDVGRTGRGYGASGSGVGFGRGGGVMGRRGRAGSAAADTVALDCADADEVVVVEQDESGPGADDGSATQGALRATGADGAPTGEFPLRHTEVSAEISGSIARTDVEQVYDNPFAEPIEAVYVFPLPALGAVNDFAMEVGGRRIVGLIRPREEAQRIYAEARARGQTASLLTQERPNVFTQSVANIEPGGEVKIKITYFERLSYADGNYEWVFPMVVGPRYIPGDASDPTAAPAADAVSGGDERRATSDRPPAAPGGGGTAATTQRVPDADRITPPVLRPGERSGHDIGLTLTLDAGLPIRSIRSVAHQVEIREVSETQRIVTLAAADAIPNKDFVLRWSVAGDETQFGVLAHRADDGGYLSLTMQPPLEPRDDQVTPREITFLIDVSGSQRGLPLATSKALVERALDQLRPDDLFNVFYFASGNGQLWDEPRPRTPENVAAAKEFLGTLSGSGGTEMLDGIRRALHGAHDARYLQMFVFLTDGYVGNEEEIVRFVKDERGTARFFVFGIGSSVNRLLVDGVAKFGGGSSDVVLPQAAGDGCRALDRLFAAIDSPVLVDVTVDWNGLPVVDAYPSRLPDLFAGQTINVVARYTAAAEGTAYVEARVGNRHVRYPVAVVLPEAETAHEALAPIWARWRIADLSDELAEADAPRAAELQQQITDLAVEFRLVSAFTAFVAVDESRVVGDGNPLHVAQPVELPAGVSYEGVFGETPGGTVDLPKP